MGKRPQYSGEITTHNQDRIGSIALWKNEKKNEKQPEYTGTVSFYDGEKRFKVAVWKQKNKQEKKEPKDTIPKFCKSRE
ncbi:hypothetical protein AKJ62_00090 [candidate division MSBL1 archaeon SCGC-AAA259D14]|uniref:Uncharacterized protein n=1 Tax=candidate division MSBL1 archaeon SCGC-AAA259D14 TaxID=1698261 RepID=A0A133U958_9EURY|nr:hypothetical protein AKJ62_00090 [candidate division MSBL1 archaeon SCGC-AAA259D14]